MKLTPPQAPPRLQQERRLLLHLKCLVWCLHQMQTRYDLNLVLYSLERGALHPDLRDSNLGDNVAYLLERLEEEDITRVRDAIARLPGSEASLALAETRLDIGHYVQAARDFGAIRSGTYGVISAVSPRPHGLFLVDGLENHLIESPFDPADVRTIFGTYIV